MQMMLGIGEKCTLVGKDSAADMRWFTVVCVRAATNMSLLIRVLLIPLKQGRGEDARRKFQCPPCGMQITGWAPDWGRAREWAQQCTVVIK